MAVSTKPYIGSRDFYPDDMRFRTYMFEKQRLICKQFGYLEYQAPILEPLSLYQAKSSEEIVGEQIYRFTDRGDRDVAIRPEMTPTLARMVAGKWKELASPLRWFSIANFMRYERPGRGRLREFYQLNVDLIGVSSAVADAEVMLIGIKLLQSFGATFKDFTLRYSDRRLMDSYFKGLDSDIMREIGRLLDKREKIGEEKFLESLKALCADESCVERVQNFLKIDSDDLERLSGSGDIDPDASRDLIQVRRILDKAGVGECVKFDPAIVRGFDYYTGIIFEINDEHPENRRALFGGGRYDRLLGLFGNEQIPAVGFGMGDVTLENFLDIHELRPANLIEPSGIYISLFSEQMLEATLDLAGELRESGLEVETSLEASGKFKKQLQTAERKGRRYVLILGETELETGIVRVKDLVSGDQTDVKRSELVSFLQKMEMNS